MLLPELSASLTETTKRVPDVHDADSLLKVARAVCELSRATNFAVSMRLRPDPGDLRAVSEQLDQAVRELSARLHLVLDGEMSAHIARYLSNIADRAVDISRRADEVAAATTADSDMASVST